MPLKIVKAGVLDLVQDCGRYGFSSLGINPGGMMDSFAGRLANVLAGNSIDKALLEIHYPAPQIQFTEDVMISIAGADFDPKINDEPIPCWHPVLVRKYSVLSFGGCRSGARSYLAVHGGLYMEKWLNSYSTNLKAGTGGWKGRKLEKGDELPFGYSHLDYPLLWKSKNSYQVLPWSPDVKSVYDNNGIFIMAGHEWNALDDHSKEIFINDRFTITNESDRMGYRLHGEPLKSQPANMVSAPVSFGTIQLLPGGQLVILMADHQTTGGYPRIGHVISAHLPKLAQRSANESLQFSMVTLSEAESLLVAQEKELQNLEALCNDHLNEYICRK